ncbi:helix-turn-helix domain-containing protein [Deltaproteobacteria bacterium]|nr:helix-turn-helix domain-containing protein [Deltaproteobacteria bacterium]
MTLEELGATLRTERKKRALSIEDMADTLKIGARLLRAMEEGDMVPLPHPAYAKGFIRAYSSFFGLAAEDMVSALQSLDVLKTGATIQAVYIPDAVTEPRSSPKWLGPAVMALLCMGGAYFVLHTNVFNSLDRPPQRLTQPAQPVALPQAPPQERKVRRSKLPATAAADKTAAQARPERAATPLPVESADAAAAKPAAHNVIVTAVEKCWIHSRADHTGTRKFLLHKGDTFALTFSKKLEIKFGNAGGVRIRYNGEEIPTPGQSGQVRTLVFPPATRQE